MNSKSHARRPGTQHARNHRGRRWEKLWIAVSVYVLVAIVRKRLGLEASLYQILQILSLTLFEKVPILRALQAFDSQEELPDPGNQLILFDF
jgi:hypothetical protein